MENGSQIRLEQNNLASAIDYIWGVAIMFACFIAVQRTLVWMVGMKYRDLPKSIRKQWSK